MTYIDRDLPQPARAKPRAVAVSARRPTIFTTAFAIRFGAVLAALLALFLIGQAAAQATESLAIGIIAADLVFLLLVAGWSALGATSRR